MRKGCHHSIVGTLIHLYGGDDWDLNLLMYFVGGIVVPDLMSSFLCTSWLVVIFQEYIKTCREEWVSKLGLH